MDQKREIAVRRINKVIEREFVSLADVCITQSNRIINKNKLISLSNLFSIFWSRNSQVRSYRR